MRCWTERIPMSASIPVVAAMAILAIVACGGEGSRGGAEGGASKSKAKPKAFEDRGTLTGRVIVKNFKDEDVQVDLKGRSDKQLEFMKARAEFRPCCGGGVPQEDLDDQTWIIGQGGGLKNVVVWLSPPEDSYFQLSKDDLDSEKAGWEKEKVLDQPHCQFHPHVMVVFQSYKDEEGKKQKTGQKVIAKNSALTEHNTKIAAIGVNVLLASSKSEGLPALDPSEKKSYEVNCNIHTWMGGHIWSFDHPFAAVTDKDGKFAIKNAPAGSEVRLMVWHEKLGRIKDGEKITIKKDEDKKLDDVSVEYKK